MSHPRSTIKTYSRRRTPYDRLQTQRNSDSLSHEQGASENVTHMLEVVITFFQQIGPITFRNSGLGVLETILSRWLWDSLQSSAT